MDTGLRLIDVLVVLLDYLSWWSPELYDMKVWVEQFAATVMHYTVIQWW